jgi:hypothetical protein
MTSATISTRPGHSNAEMSTPEELAKFEKAFPVGEILDDNGHVDDGTILHNAIERISMYSPCQCTSAHGDNQHCPVLIADQALEAAGLC